MMTFEFSKVPPLSFGINNRTRLPNLLKTMRANKILLITGGRSLKSSGFLDDILRLFEGLEVDLATCVGEPSCQMIDDVCNEFRSKGIEVVIAIGGGSVIDAGKAISAMLPHENSVFDHLEGVGKGIHHCGLKVPFIAVPTTSGTGSEATKNAVLSEVGPNGYKKSLRHDNFIPDYILVDGELLTSCPRHVSAACGMDALTQLLEPYLSPRATVVTDMVCLSGLEKVKDNLLRACGDGASSPDIRLGMAYASFWSGVALANAGLGIVHGLASPLGGFFPVPHGVVCGTLVASAAEMNLRALKERDPYGIAMDKIAKVGRLFSKETSKTDDYYRDAFVDVLKKWTEELGMPLLSDYGVSKEHFSKVLKKTKNRDNPIHLSPEEIQELISHRI